MAGGASQAVHSVQQQLSPAMPLSIVSEAQAIVVDFGHQPGCKILEGEHMSQHAGTL